MAITYPTLEEETPSVTLNTLAIMEMRLCEQNRVTMKPNRLYVFTVDLTCPKCVQIAATCDPS